jgi:hypothetical protein
MSEQTISEQAASEQTAQFRFSLGRMLLLIAVAGVWIAGVRVRSGPWSMWLTTAVFYLSVALCFTPSAASRP